MKRALCRAGLALCALAALRIGPAGAQQPEPLARPESTEAPPRHATASPAGDSDLDLVNPGIGFGWFGLSDLPVGPGSSGVFQAPVIGIRWWMGAPLGPFRAWGLDLGIGFGRRSADGSPRDVTRTGVLVHAGLPLAVSAGRHVVVEFVPEANIGFASGQESDGTDVGGSRLDVGARAGAEVFFGFIGLPQLSLEGSVGFSVSRENRTTKPPGAGESSTASLTVGTAHGNDPWDLFRTGIAARYYF